MVCELNETLRNVSQVSGERAEEGKGHVHRPPPDTHFGRDLRRLFSVNEASMCG